MKIPLLEKIRGLQSVLLDIGVASSVLALPKPKTSEVLALPGPSHALFGYEDVIDDPLIVGVSRDLFGSGHFAIAVQEAFKALDKLVAERSCSSESGVKLMRSTFSTSAPRLAWSDRTTQSQQDEHEGYGHIYAGVMLGIRNPLVHDFNWVENADDALELLLVAQHLVKKVRKANIVA